MIFLKQKNKQKNKKKQTKKNLQKKTKEFQNMKFLPVANS